MSAWETRCHPDDFENVKKNMKDHFRQRAEYYVAEYRVRCKDESWKWINTRGMVVKRAPDGKPLRMIGIHADITLRKKLEEEMRLANTAYSLANEAMLITDGENRIASVNAAFTRITGYTLEEVKGRNPGMLSAKRHDHDFYVRMWNELIEKGSWTGEVLNRRKNGQTYHEWLSIKRILDEHGRVVNHVAIFSDITNRKEAEARIRHLALHDALTGLPNRTLLNERMDQAILRSRRDDTKFALLYFDLDKFKPVNDMHGHDVGDWLLIQVAERVMAILRESDTVSRLGGDEFVVLLAKIELQEDAMKVAGKILSELSRPFDFAQQKLQISSSIGVAIYPEHGKEEKTLTRHADAAMYHAKKQGRGRVVLYQPGMEHHHGV
jgi:diguanylate cyclase (GGDEF)-like protein/PAS domain S-box-containing protein